GAFPSSGDPKQRRAARSSKPWKSELSLQAHLVAHRPRDAENLDACGNAAIDRDLDECRAQFLVGQVVADRTAKMDAEFVHAVQRREHAQIEKAALLQVEPLVRPGRTPAIFVEQILERPREIVAV